METFDNEALLYWIGISRCRKENALSDCVWAMAQANKVFLQAFFKFCFNNDVNVYCVGREVIIKDAEPNGCRNDFAFYTDEGVFIVESKIDDGNVGNSEKYLQLIKESTNNEDGFLRLTYILPRNYDYNKCEELKKKNINVVYWEYFVDEIQLSYRSCALAISSFLNYKNLFKDDVDTSKKQNMIQMCEEFIDSIKPKHANLDDQKKHQQWEADLCYGFNICASVYIGVKFIPFKGLIFYFSYGNGGDKKIMNIFLEESNH